MRFPTSSCAGAPLPLVLTLCAALAVLPGCASVVAPPSQIAGAVQRYGNQAQPSPAAADAGVPAGIPMVNWWKGLQDPTLDELVAQAMQHNHELHAAIASVRAARATADAAYRDALPQGGLAAQAQTLRPSLTDVDPYRQGLPRPPISNVASIDQTLSWEIDLFGRIGTAAAVADRRADALSADLHATTVLLQGEVVRAYTRWRHAQQDLLSLGQESALLERRAGLLQARFAAGLADRREALAVQNELARIASERTHLRAQVKVHEAALAVLIGKSPSGQALGDKTAGTAQLPAVPPDTAIRYPDDLLARRPDIAKADAQLRASIGEAVLAERAHLPRLSLNLSAGLSAPFGQLGNAGAIRYAAGPALSWDWMNAGRAKARAAAAKQGQLAAWHNFEQAVLKALEDSEGSLRQWSAAQQALAETRSGEQAARQVWQHSQVRADAGLEPSVQALEHGVAYQRARRATLAAQADALLAFAQVQLALGAWQADKNATAAM